ncbi:AMP-binding protein [Elongatibacter sediminis]|uniref:AMP-binding protein n=1 Tax=Elongatibacter sediminis TaxID=3119006 RepID=A0AAW9REP5_9GAMM
MIDSRPPAVNEHPRPSTGELPEMRLDLRADDDGTVHLRYAEPLAAFDPAVIRHLARHAVQTPDRPIYGQRRRGADGAPGDWQTVSFAEAHAAATGIGQWLIDQGLGPRDTVLIASGNSIGHALMRLACLAAGVTACPVSANYALMGGGYERLRYVMDLVEPRVVFAEDSGRLGPALEAIAGDGTEHIAVTADPSGINADAVAWESVREYPAGEEIRARIAATDVDEHAVYVLTSGSTGMPKAVVQTQRMLTTNLFQAYQVLGGMSGWDDVMLDWLPWSHVSGAFNLLAAAVFGGTLYIDEGKPAPGLFEETLHNLREISVPYFCNVPAGFAMLIDELEADEELQKRFFAKLRMVLYGGAGLPQPLLDRLQRMAQAQTGRSVFTTTGYGATETASGCMAIYFHTDKVGIGLPMPGLDVKLVPHGDRYEIRLKGDNVMSGYLNNPEATAQSFDKDGFYRTGDAARFHDEAAPEKGLYFAGRLAEEFKLGTGTWIYAGQVRARVIEALSPVITDLLLCGLGRDYLAVLGVPSPAGLREIAGQPEAAPDTLVTNPAVIAHVRQALEAWNAGNPGSSTAIRRFAFMREPPSAARHELSDKGTVNQLLAAENRPEEIDALYAESPDPHVIVI